MRAGLPSRSSSSALSISSQLRLGVLLAGLGLLLQRQTALLEAFEIGQHQLGLDGLGVGDGRDAALDVRDVVVLEAAQHVGDGVDLANVAQKLIAQAFALGGAAHQAGNVDERQPRRNSPCRLADLSELVEARIGHADIADIRLDRAERIVGRFRRCRLRERVEERGLANVWQADDAAFEAHVSQPGFFWPASHRFRLAASEDCLLDCRSPAGCGAGSLSVWRRRSRCLGIGRLRRISLKLARDIGEKAGLIACGQPAGRVGDSVEQRLEPFAIRLCKVTQHPAVHQLLAAGMTDADAHAAVVVADMAGDGAQAVVAGVAAASLDLQLGRARGRSRRGSRARRPRELVKVHGFRDSAPAVVHVGLGLEQQHLMAADLARRRRDQKTSCAKGRGHAARRSGQRP